MRETFRQAWQYLWVRVAVYTLLIVLVLYYLNWALAMARSAIVTVLIAVVFSYITSPIVRWFERRRLSRALGVVVVFVGFLLFVALASVLLANMAGQLAGFLTGLSEPLAGLLAAGGTVAFPVLEPWILLGTAGAMIELVRLEILPQVRAHLRR